MGADYDFSGWATRNNIKCADGRTIRDGAFKECDGKRVPIVWSHNHDDPDLVLGHGDLRCVPEGVRIDGKLNDSPKGRQTKLLMEHGDIVGLSIWANHLKQNGGDVLHGDIKEVSVVLAGANPGAFIDTLYFAHGDEESTEEAVCYTDEPLVLIHADKDDDEEEKDTEETEEIEETEEGETDMAEKKQVNPDPKESEEDDDETIGEVFDTLTDKQKNVVYALIGEALRNAGADDEDDDEETEDEDEEEPTVKHNVFDSTNEETNVLSHDDMTAILTNAKKCGSLRDAFHEYVGENGYLSHTVTDDDNNTVTYGMANVKYLFPDARAIDSTPQFIKRNDEWVNAVINGTHHTPFSRVKTILANITIEEARARGYVKGNQKTHEVMTLLKRSTDPQTIYKLQKMDRDDVLDITDFDVVAWLRGEMRMMLNEEIARAILIGDGKLSTADDHISEDHIRPIVSDSNVYTITQEVIPGTPEETAKAVIKGAIRGRTNYKGSGTPVMFVPETLLTEMMLLEDTLGHPLYADEAALARRMRVSKVIPCPVMDNFTIDSKAIYGIIVNLTDYNIGADKGGEINMFDDFDINYNQQSYLIETRISGALVRPYSAIVLKECEAETETETDNTDDTDNG